MKKLNYIILLSLSLLFLYSCVGEDIIAEPEFNLDDLGEDVVVIDRPVFEEEIRVSSVSVGLMTNGSPETITAMFLDTLGEEVPTAEIIWESENEEIAIVDNGLITPVGEGSTNITASFGDAVTTISVNVVADQSVPSQIIVILDGIDESLEPGQTLPLEVRVLNLAGDELQVEDIVWTVDDETVATVDANNILTAIADGSTQFSVSANGLTSGSMSVTVLTPFIPPIYLERTSTFSGSLGYTTNGTATLRQEVATGEITLILSDDFFYQGAIANNLFLSSASILNSSNRSSDPHFQIDPELSIIGAQTYNLTAEGYTGNINSFDHLLVMCTPVFITFGTSEFGEIEEIRE